MLEGIFGLVVVGAVIGVSWRYRRLLSETFALLRHARASIALLVVAALLYGAGQTREVLWADYEQAFTNWVSPPAGDLGDVLLFAKLVLSSITWAGPLSILLLAFCFAVINPDYHRVAWRKQSETSVDIAVAWLSGQVAALIFLAVVFYNILAALNVPIVGLKGWAVFAINVAIVALPIAMLGGFLSNFVDPIKRPAKAEPRVGGPRPPKKKPQRDLRAILGSAAVVVPFGALLLFAFAICGIGFALFVLAAPLQLLGINLGGSFSDVLVIINLFLGGLIMLLSLLGWLRGRDVVAPGEPQRSVGAAALAGWPLLGVLVLLGVALSFVNLNDNHEVRARASLCPKPGQEPTRPTIAEAYRTWLSQRVDANSSTFPVYVIAAEGGGIYAAYHTALFLAAVQDRYPDFARHVFAISGVSGGSLGASVFTSLLSVRRDPRVPDWYWQKTRAILGGDFLSDVSYSALFTDLPAALLPCFDGFCPGRRLDRALALEDSFDAAWRDVMTTERDKDKELFQRSAMDWRPGTPALLLNTTEVETGRRVVISPFNLAETGEPTLRSLGERAPCLDVSLATGVGLSARFPLLTPAGWFKATKPDAPLIMTAAPPPAPNRTAELLKPGAPAPADTTETLPARRSLVDGAYVDNSGIATALDVLLALQRAEQSQITRQGRVRFVLIVLKTVLPGEDAAPTALGQLLAPARALQNVRAAAADTVLKQAAGTLDGLDCASDPGRCPFSPATRVAPLVAGRLPLGWMLSEQSRAAIEKNDFMGRCPNERWPYTALPPQQLSADDAYRHKCALINRIGAEIAPRITGTGSLPTP